MKYKSNIEVDENTLFWGILEELPENNSAVENTNKKSVAFDITLSDDETTQKKALFKSEIADEDEDEEKHQQMTILNSQNLTGDREDETEWSFIEKSTCHGNEGDHCNESHMAVLQNEREEITQHEFENKPVPKLREHRIKNISSGKKKALEYCCCYLYIHIIIFLN